MMERGGSASQIEGQSNVTGNPWIPGPVINGIPDLVSSGEQAG